MALVQIPLTDYLLFFILNPTRSEFLVFITLYHFSLSKSVNGTLTDKQVFINKEADSVEMLH